MSNAYVRPCGCTDINCARPEYPCWDKLPKCSVCGHAEYLNLMYEGDVCHHCQFWLDHIQYRVDQPERFFVIDGCSYSPGDEDARGMRGFGGLRFHIRRFDGTEVITTNLYTQGDVCAKFRDRLPDNAVFVRQQRS